MTRQSLSMEPVLERLAREDAGLGDPTRLAPRLGRALAEMVNFRWNTDLPPLEARTVLIGGLPARLVTPANDDGRHAILHVHGGGWAFCSAMTHEGAARRLAIACGCPVLTFDYRLAPEHPFPAGLDDIETAWEARDRTRGWSIAGDSAGANLALALMLRRIAAGADLPQMGLLFYGVYGADFETPSYRTYADGPGLTRDKMRRYWDWYCPTEHRRDATAAPLAADDGVLRALPPLYLNAAEIDPLSSDSDQLAARLHALGRSDPYDRVEGVVHGFMQMGSVLPEARAAFERAGEVFQRTV
ncbi:alpha/beta hydrolase [Frigidibacter sp. ROC022]|uniref:alpha/beta hydrolase n=1 Tax=Frigidibacter sp. ROC022 TaxID=2971796 RepID=UPI00215A291A|nr:alpha/beta hydrolase [Frigidibacter sp. ROC022]MCR8726476.1 alpha/beta hydrolase [Frigidibacter sp. ROC022]